MRRIAVIGPAGSGKSFLINQILGREEVKHEVSAHPVTKVISSHKLIQGDQAMELVDTPGLCGEGVQREKIEDGLRTRFDSIHNTHGSRGSCERKIRTNNKL